MCYYFILIPLSILKLIGYFLQLGRWHLSSSLSLSSLCCVGLGEIQRVLKLLMSALVGVDEC